MAGAEKFQPENSDFVYGRIKVVGDNRHSRSDSPQDEVKFVFNPAQLAMTATAKWEQPAAGGAKKSTAPTYKGADPQSMELNFTLDAWDKEGHTHSAVRDIQKDIDTLISWTRPTQSSRTTKKPAPPFVELDWGPERFKAYVASVNTTITMFDKKGFPLRATMKVSLKEVPPKDGKQNPTSGSRVGHQSHTFIDGETLAGIAHKYYEQPKYWRGLAISNGIDDPSRVRPGQRLYIPPIEDVAVIS